MSIGPGRAMRRRTLLAGVFVLTLASIASTSLWALVSTTSPEAVAAVRSRPPAPGYWLVASDGGIFSYGDAGFYGSAGSIPLNRPIVGMAPTPDGGGYWLVASDGGIFSYGDAGFYGSAGSIPLNRPIVGMAPTPDGGGYWLVASDGGIFSYGDAGFYGSAGSIPLNRPIVGMAPTPDGGGYWLVASDGGIFSYGDAGFYGSAGSIPLNRPIVGMAPTPDGGGYWLVASDGGIFSYGDAGFYGSAGSIPLNRPIVGMAPTPDGGGYWLVASDGGIFSYGDAGFYGSAGSIPLNRPIVGMAPTPDGAARRQATGAMSAPPGYSSSRLIFDDQFSGTTLDSSKWVTYLGSSGAVWNDNGFLPWPYSGPTLPDQGGSGNNAAMFGPSQVRVDAGLTLTAQRNTNAYSADYPWMSGIVTTEGKFTLPATGWYVQVEAKMPDQSQGMWPSIWFLPPVPNTPFNELDGYEGGMKMGSEPPNMLMSTNYFADQGQQGSIPNTGADLSAGYHVYGIQYIPGQSITEFLDGRQVSQVLASGAVTITPEPYQIMLSLYVAAQQTSGWHTVTNADTPTSTMDVAEVQAYSY